MGDEAYADYYTLPEFLSEAGFTKQDLYALWERGNGPPRVKVRDRMNPAGRVLIPRAEGQRWLEEREDRAIARQQDAA